MKSNIILIFTILFLCSTFISKADVKLFAPSEELKFDTIPYMVYNPYFEEAYMELADMFDGKIPYSFKRAEFLVEYAYYDGNIEYSKFCHDIDSIAKVLNHFIDINNIRQYKTAPNFALFEYFTKPSIMNGNCKISYDFENATGESDFSIYMASNLIKTHKGQCVSMPVLYKILCDELGGHSALALAPLHMYIKHIGEDGQWVNVELTSGSFSSDAWIMESMHISAEAIKNGIYMVALNDTENVALMINLLTHAYLHKYNSQDYFVERNINKILERYPDFCETLGLEYDMLRTRGLQYIEKFGPDGSYFLDNGYQRFLEVKNRLDALGHFEPSIEECLERINEGIRYTQEHEHDYE